MGEGYTGRNGEVVRKERWEAGKGGRVFGL